MFETSDALDAFYITTILRVKVVLCVVWGHHRRNEQLSILLDAAEAEASDRWSRVFAAGSVGSRDFDRWRVNQK